MFHEDKQSTLSFTTNIEQVPADYYTLQKGTRIQITYGFKLHGTDSFAQWRYHSQ